MRDIARALDGEDKAIGRRFPPGCKTLGALQPVKGAVDLDRRKMPRRIGQLLALRQAFGKEDAAPAGIGPARNADPDRALLRRGHVETVDRATGSFDRTRKRHADVSDETQIDLS